MTTIDRYSQLVSQGKQIKRAIWGIVKTGCKKTDEVSVSHVMKKSVRVIPEWQPPLVNCLLLLNKALQKVPLWAIKFLTAIARRTRFPYGARPQTVTITAKSESVSVVKVGLVVIVV